MRSLLDVNLLVAILDAQHEHHHKARLWLGTQGDAGWASCPITENGCVRVLSRHGYPGACTPQEAMGLLDNLISLGRHEFWPDDVSLLDSQTVDRTKIQGAGQLTDLYLLALAIRRGGRLATLDHSIPTLALYGVTSQDLFVIS